MSEQEQVAAQQAVTYVVQRRGENELMWFDLATVEVPPRTKRWTVIEAGLRQAGLSPADGPVFVRVLDGNAARVDALVPDVPVEPRWKVADR